MRLTEPITSNGYFWRANKPEKRVAGRISVSDGGEIKLSLFEGFDGLGNHILDVLRMPEGELRLYGVVDFDKPITLEDCIYTSPTQIFAHRAFWDVNLEKEPAPLWEQITFSVEGLDEWYGESSLKFDFSKQLDYFKIEYQKSEIITLWADDGLELELLFSPQFPGFPPTSEAIIRNKAHFRLKSNPGRELGALVTYLSRIVLFVGFAIDKVASVRDVSVGSSKYMTGGVNDDQYKRKIAVYYQPVFHADVPPRIEHFRNIFSFKEVKENFSVVLSKWLNLYKAVTPSMNLYFSTKNGDYQFLENPFLSLTQSLEAFHRERFDSELRGPFNKSEWAAIKEKILQCVPVEHQQWVVNKIQHVNAATFRQRFEHLFGAFGDLFGSDHEIKDMVKKIADCRNYFTHLPPGLAEKAAKGPELVLLCQKLTLVFQLCVLRELGFSTDDIARMAIKLGASRITPPTKNLVPKEKTGESN